MKRASQRTSLRPLTPLERPREETDITRLERRLDAGYKKIEAKLQAGEDVAELEEFWFNLLRQYVALCDATPMAA